ncbi:hypothetical protein NE237_029460 [Protea cynaroides]|uniref:Uncharacterized protein n=1 Tax=Protea cynaroides TaxID=273540 RepID=A0A9Q0GTX9_9MAGN|nr:hypothetical protein NE237_029460 [Protea cynaroides]
MVVYLSKVRESVAKLDSFTLRHVPRNQNEQTDILSKLASEDLAKMGHVVYIEVLEKSSIRAAEGDMMIGQAKWNKAVTMENSWVHATSLIHDDLPCMDDDLVRRGRLTNHVVYGVDMAILAGDAQFPLGFRHIASQTPSDLVPEPRLLGVVAEIARAVGFHH